MTKQQKPLMRARFRLYRYQILPISQSIQLQFAPEIKSLADLKAKKNCLFADALQHCKFEKSEKVTHDAIQSISPDVYVLRLAINRTIHRNTRDFAVESIDDWPYCWIVINNNPSIQKIAIQINPKAMSISTTIANVINKCLEEQLRHYQLCPIIEPMFDQREFWGIVGKNHGKLIQVDFELISPNLANISSNVFLDLHSLQQSTNTQRTHFQLNSDKESCLTVNPKDRQLASLVNYASEGGGDISMRIRGYRKKIRTRDSVKEITIDGIDIENASPAEIVARLENLENE